jgi:hypothetical protein
MAEEMFDVTNRQPVGSAFANSAASLLRRSFDYGMIVETLWDGEEEQAQVPGMFGKSGSFTSFFLYFLRQPPPPDPVLRMVESGHSARL